MKDISKCSAKTSLTHIMVQAPRLDKDMVPLLRSQSVTVRGWHIEIAMKGEVVDNLSSARLSRCYAQMHAFEKGWQKGSKRRENSSTSSVGSELGCFYTALHSREGTAVVRRLRERRSEPGREERPAVDKGRRLQAFLRHN